MVIMSDSHELNQYGAVYAAGDGDVAGYGDGAVYCSGYGDGAVYGHE